MGRKKGKASKPARISGIPERSLLERTQTPGDEISWQMGYKDPAFFRRLFKRITGVTAGAYRRKFQNRELG